MKKRWIPALILTAAIYLALVALMYVIEHNAPGAMITSFPLALWYSLVTLTTVGYGDLTPVTAAGRILGVIFLLFSAGFLTFILGTLLSLLPHDLKTRFRLARLRRRRWNLFSAINTRTVTLGRDILRTSPNDVLIYMGDASGQSLPSEGHVITTDLPIEAIMEMNHEKNCRLFFMEEDSFLNYGEALLYADSGNVLSYGTYHRINCILHLGI